MSVFSDFQRMWLQRFPENSLSDEWEKDVKASLIRHKQKMVDLRKELEQETLYVEYLERLLDDVDQFRNAGGDPLALINTSVTTAKINNAGADKNDDIGNSSSGSSHTNSNAKTTTIDATIPTSHGHENVAAAATTATDENGISHSSSSESAHFASDEAENSNYENCPMAELRNKTESQGALHHQCIDELTSHIRSAQQQRTGDVGTAKPEIEEKKSQSPSRSVTPTSFVTVIEVKDSSPVCSSPTPPPTSLSTIVSAAANVSGEVAVISSPSHSIDDSSISETLSRSDESVISTVQNLEVKRKIPPRPPPKIIRRVGPLADSPVAITETPPSPSNAGIAHTTSPSMTTSTINSAGTTSTPINKSENVSSGSLDSNVKPSEFLRHKHDEKLSSVLLKFSHGNIAKSGSNSSSESLINSTNNEENLNIESFPISERIKSYESISSLSSDGLKVGTFNSSGGGSGTHERIHVGSSGGANQSDLEPYYDTVPIEETDDEIEAEISNSSSSRHAATSSLPKLFDRQISCDVGGHAGERVSNYINIDYFLSQNRKLRDSSNESDEELEPPASPPPRSTIDDSKNILPSKIKAAQDDTHRNIPIRNIISSIITSETFYVECLTKMLHYMKAMRATLTTSRPVISEKEFQTMFFKIDELYEVHTAFLNSLKTKIVQDAHDMQIGGPFVELANHIHIYGAFLHNYGQAIDTVKKCGENNVQFKEIVSKIVLNSQNEQLLTLEDLLHKPVARLQKNALVLQDLIKETPSTHPDYKPLIHAQKTIHKLLSEFNVVQNKTAGEDKALRRLVKNSFIVELADGHRKLRHLFLFNDVIACAKYKASGRDRFEFELKWFISLKDIFIPADEASLGINTMAAGYAATGSPVTASGASEVKETNPVNLLSLKSQASTVRDLILAEDRDDKKHKSYSSRSMDKYRKKLHDIEAQLVLASPNLVFRLGNKLTNKISTFFLSSQFERSQWIDTIIDLQESCNLPSAQQVNLYDLQAWIAACQTFVKTEMGSYLMRNSRDESLLVGDLHLTIIGVSGFDKPSDLFCCVEVDSYGHYFRKASTKTLAGCVNPQWNEYFLVELEGCQNMRFLLYEDTDASKPILRAEHVLKLSRKWLQDTTTAKSLKLSDAITLNIVVKFVNEELQSCRVPTTKPGPLFGVKLQQVLKREKRDIPFIITSCIREVERRGMLEVGIYRVSGSASDLARLKKAFETNNYEAEQLLKDVDIHSVTGIFKSYLRELPETLFTDVLYRKFIETFNKFSNINENELSIALQVIYSEVAAPNKTTINFILDHLLKVHQQEVENKMSLHNLAMVFGPTLLRPAQNSAKQKDQLEASTVDVMAQAGILYCFLQARKK